MYIWEGLSPKSGLKWVADTRNGLSHNFGFMIILHTPEKINI